jgi:hypothetical protein
MEGRMATQKKLFKVGSHFITTDDKSWVRKLCTEARKDLTEINKSLRESIKANNNDKKLISALSALVASVGAKKEEEFRRKANKAVREVTGNPALTIGECNQMIYSVLANANLPTWVSALFGE